MAKRKSNVHIELELIKKFKINPCSVNMALFNPALWIYNYTIDVMKKRNKQLDSKSIIRIINGYANSEKPLIPISYIDRKDVYRVIVHRGQFREFTNVDALIPDYFPDFDNNNKQQPKKLSMYAKYIYKQLKESEFRQTELFNNIKINSKGLFEIILLLSCDINNLLPVNIETPVEVVETNNTLKKIYFENNTNFKNILSNCRTQEEFVSYTNIKQLAKVQIDKRGLGNIDEFNKNALIEIIIINTWKQLNHQVLKIQQTQFFDLNRSQFNCESLLHRYTLDRMRELKYQYDTNTMIRIKTLYSNCDKCLVPITYLNNNEILEIFPNLFTLVKFTNILKSYRDCYRSLRDDIINRNLILIQCIKTQALHVYEKLVNDPHFKKNEANQKILVNCKFIFNKSATSKVEANSIDEEIIEYFKKLVPPNKSSKIQVNINSSSDIPIKHQNRRRAKLLNQIQAKLNISEEYSGDEIVESYFNTSSKSNVTVIQSDLATIHSAAGQQTIVVPEYNTQQIKECAGSNEKLFDIELGATFGILEDNILRKTKSSHPQPDQMSCVEIVSASESKMSFSESSASNNLAMIQKDSNDYIKKKLCNRNSAKLNSVECVANKIDEFITIEDSPIKSQKTVANLESPTIRDVLGVPYSENVANSSVEFLGNKVDEVITIENSPRISQRIRTILDTSSANLSEIIHISYADTVVQPNNIAEMRRQNCKKKISKNPELEIPVMRNTYRPLLVKKKL